MRCVISVSIDSELAKWFSEYCESQGKTVSGQMAEWVGQLHKKMGTADLDTLNEQVEQDKAKKAEERQRIEEHLVYSRKCNHDGEEYLKWKLNHTYFAVVVDLMTDLGYTAKEIDAMEERWARWEREDEENK